MNLEIQIQSLFSTFIYGMFVSLLYNLSYFLLYSRSIIKKIIFNFIYSFIVFSSYFTILLIINNGIVHIYHILLLILGFIIGNKKTKKIRTDLKKSN